MVTVVLSGLSCPEQFTHGFLAVVCTITHVNAPGVAAFTLMAYSSNSGLLGNRPVHEPAKSSQDESVLRGAHFGACGWARLTLIATILAINSNLRGILAPRVCS